MYIVVSMVYLLKANSLTSRNRWSKDWMVKYKDHSLWGKAQYW
jgi:hypothetical protein